MWVPSHQGGSMLKPRSIMKMFSVGLLAAGASVALGPPL